MSTSVALQQLDPFTHKEVGTLRQRKTSSPPASQPDDTWLETPQDTESSKLPIDSNSFKPTTLYWITPHGLLTKNITIFDLTKDIDVPYGTMTNDCKAAIQRTLKDHSSTPAFTCLRSNWLGLQHDIRDDQDNHIAQWSHPWSSFRESTLTFPEDSPHSSHPISSRNRVWGLRTESFTLDSQPYFWESDSIWHSTNITLYRITGIGDEQKKVEIGKYAQKWWGAFVTGGSLAVDAKEIDPVVACLTLLIVLKKKRQRSAERRYGGD